MDGQYGKKIIVDSLKIGFDLLKSSIKDGVSKFNYRRLLAVICLCSVFGVSAANINYAYAVSFDGQIICYADNWTELNKIIKNVEDTASKALGYEFTLDSDLTTKLSIGTTETTDASKLETLLLSSIPEIRYLYTVSLDGRPICAFEDETTAKNALNKYLSEYTNKNSISAEFVGNVSIEQKYAKTELLVDEGSCMAAMSPYIKIQSQESKTVEEDIAYDVKLIDDNSLVIGKTITQVEGVNGKALAEYKITNINGALNKTELQNYNITSEPVSAVVIKGTREAVSTGTYIWPTTGELSSNFGYRTVSIGSSNHKGIDIADDYGTAINAADGGIVIMAEYYYGYGKMIKIEHDNGDITYYAHLSSIDVEVGDLVKQGDYIGAMGCSGTASGTHLHFEYRPNGGDSIDPITVLP